MKRLGVKGLLLASGSVAIMASAAPAMAVQTTTQDASNLVIEEITVTSRKRAETLRDVPFSVNAQSESQMRNSGANNIEDVSRNIVGLTVQNLGPGQSQVAVRGISAGQIVRDQPGVKEQVGVYLDESVISMSLFTPDLDLFDLNRVEVLRGPQGTLYGSGSLAGTIRYITNKPNVEEFEGAVEAGLETVTDGSEGYNVKAMVNIPIAPGKLALRAVGYYTDYAGFIDAVQPDGSINKDVNDGDRTGIRMSLAFKPSDTVTITPRIIYQDISVNGYNRQDEFNILANDLEADFLYDFAERQQFTQTEEQFEDEFFLFDNTIEVDFDTVSLTAITSYTDREILVRRDATQLTGSITGQPGVLSDDGLGPDVYGITSPLDDETSAEVFTQEIRLSSTDDGPFQWVIGGFYSDIKRQYAQTLNVPGFEDLTGIPTAGQLAQRDQLFLSRIPYDFEQYALFGEASYDVSDKLSVTAGMRWFDFTENRELNFDGIFAAPEFGTPGKTSSDGISPRFIVSYDATDSLTVNAQVSKGFRLGGINDPLNEPLCSEADKATFGGRENFDDEEVWNYEVGAKAEIDGGRGSFNVAGFYTNISNLQVTLDAGTCSSRIIFNADAKTVGAEAEFAYKLSQNFDVALGASLTDSEFTDTVTSDSGSGPVVVGGIADGNRLPTVPKFQFNASLNYAREINDEMETFSSLTFQHIGSRFTQAIDQDSSQVGVVNRIPIGDQPATTFSFDPKLGDYQIMNFRLGVRSDDWEVAAYVNNLFDENALLSLDRERGFRARVAYQTNKPRTFGVNMRKYF